MNVFTTDYNNLIKYPIYVFIDCTLYTVNISNGSLKCACVMFINLSFVSFISKNFQIITNTRI